MPRYTKKSNSRKGSFSLHILCIKTPSRIQDSFSTVVKICGTLPSPIILLLNHFCSCIWQCKNRYSLCRTILMHFKVCVVLQKCIELDSTALQSRGQKQLLSYRWMWGLISAYCNRPHYYTQQSNMGYIQAEVEFGTIWLYTLLTKSMPLMQFWCTCIVVTEEFLF